MSMGSRCLVRAAVLAALPALGHARAAPVAAPLPAPKPMLAGEAASLVAPAFESAEASPSTDGATAPLAPEQLGGAQAVSAGGALLADPGLAAELGALFAGNVAAAARAPSAGASPAPATDADPDAAALAVAPAPEGDATPRPALMPATPTEPPLVWDDAPLDAQKAARLFEVACLATLPEFAGVGAFFESLGFHTVPGMRIRNHPRKNVSALATTPTDLMESGVRSCAILVEGLEHAPARAAVEARVASRFGPTPRFETPAKGLAHVVWVVETAFGPAKITVTESGGSAFLGATVLPPPPVGQQ